MSPREFTELDVHLALDGELPVEDRAGFDKWLEANPDIAARSSRFADDRQRLADALGGVMAEPVPDRLTRAVTGERRVRPAAQPFWRVAAAAAVIFALGAGGGYVAAIGGLGLEAEAEERLTAEALAAHATYTADRGHEVEVGADRQDYLLQWLSARTGLTIVAPDLAAEGYTLLGGRMLPGVPHPAALLLYKDASGTSLSVYVTARGGSKTWGVHEAAGRPGAVYWLDDNWGCAIVASLPAAELTDVGRKAYRQLRAGAGLG